MKLLSELYADAMKMWSAHHAEIMTHLADVMNVAAGAVNPVAGAVAPIAEDALSVLIARIEALEQKVNSSAAPAAQAVPPVLPQS